MKPSPFHFWTVPCLALLFTLSSTVAAEGKVHLVLSMKPIKAEPERKPELRRDVWLLRPNVEQEVLTYLQNEDPSQTPTVTVQLLADGAVVASQKVEKVGGKFVQVAWTRPGGPPNAPLVMSELKSPVVLRLLDSDGKKQLEAIEFGIRRPSEYLKADLEYVPATEERKNRLIATVTPTEAFEGPSCRVELVLDTSLRGFVPGKRRSGYPGYVTRPRGSDEEEGAAYVVAEDVRLREDKSKGLVTIRADDYDRAFLFDTTFARATTPVRAQKIDDRIVRINTVPMADPRKPVRVSLEADNVETPDTKRLVLDVVTVVDRGGKKGAEERFSQLAEFSGDRDKRLFGAPGSPNKGLLFKPEVKYWSTDLPLNGLRGKITLRLRLLNEKNKALPVLDTEKEKGEKVDEVRKSIVLDDTPPEGVRVEKIAKAVRGKPLLVRASGTDDESGIRDVVFFLGKPTADGKLPPQAIDAPGRQLKKDSKEWTGELVVPADQKAPLQVSVRFTNGVGLSTTEVATLLEVTDPPVVKGGKKGSIAGVVMEGDRPQRGLKVDLLNAAGKVLVSTKTGPKGEYLFKDLDPGDYSVSALKTASDTKGKKPVPLAAGEDKKGITIKLYR